MGDGADGNEIDAGGGDAGDVFKGDAARSLQQHPAAGNGDGLAQRAGRHVVQQQPVGACIEGFPDLFDGVAFDLDILQPGRLGPAGGLAGAAGDGDVVVLDQHPVVER